MIYLFPIIATNRDGDTVLLYTVAEVLSFTKGKFVGTEWIRDKPLYSWTRDPDYNEWILRDDRGRPVDYREFIPARPNYKNRRYNHTFRDGPIQHGFAYNSGPRCGGSKVHHRRKAVGGKRAHRILPDIHMKEFRGFKLRVRYFD
jgi:hypothetical protein